MQTLRAVLFDLDGVLVDSEPVWVDLVNNIVRGLGLRPLNGPGYQGMLFSQYFALVARHNNGTLDPKPLLKEALERFQERVAQLQPMPGALEAVAAAQAAMPTALVSSTPRRNVESVLRHLRLSFPVMVCGGEAGAGKPAPEPYLRAAELLKVPAADCVAVEDSRNGVASAKAAGMAVVGLRAGHNAEADVAQADAVIRSMRELPALLANGRLTRK